MKLFGSRDNIEMNAATAVRVGELFGISENTIRVTLNRLQSANLLALVERGYYRLGESGQQFASEINQWREAEAQLTQWQQDWLVVQTNALAKSDKTLQRSTARALDLVGMEKLAPDMYVRPDNLKGSAEGIRQKLHNLGLARRALVFRASDFDEVTHIKACKLWQTPALESGYKQGIQELEISLEKLTALPLDVATKESYEVGDRALHRLVFDPLLPEPLVDVALRQRYRLLVKQYDDVGAEIWHQFLQNV